MTRSVMKHLSLLCLIAFTLLCANVAIAEPRDRSARRDAYEKGFNAIERKDWAEAQRIFDELWREKRDFDVALHLGQAEFQLGRYRDAAEHLAFGVAHMPLVESDELRERSVLALEQARTKVGTLAISVNQPSAEVHIDGVLIGTAPIEGERFVVPGRHRVEALLAGYQPASTMIEIRAGEQQEIVLELTPIAKPSSPSPALSNSVSESDSGTANSNDSAGLEPREMVLAGGLALTGIAAVTTVVFALKSSSAADRANDLRAQASIEDTSACGDRRLTSPEACAKLEDAEDERTRASGIANLSLGVAGMSALATAILYFAWPGDAGDAAQRPAVLPILSHSSTGLSVIGNF